VLRLERGKAKLTAFIETLVVEFTKLGNDLRDYSYYLQPAKIKINGFQELATVAWLKPGFFQSTQSYKKWGSS